MSQFSPSKMWRLLKDYSLGRWFFARAVCMRVPYFSSISPYFIDYNPEFRDAGWEPKLQYTQQVEFANKKTTEVIEKILENNQNSIIIVQGDHGTAWDLNWKEPTRDDAWQRLRNFDAIYFPDEVKRDSLSDDRTLVNTFRTVFNEYYGSEYEILENKLYWGWNEKPYNFKEMTDYLR